MARRTSGRHSGRTRKKKRSDDRVRFDEDAETVTGLSVKKVQATIEQMSGLFWTVPEGPSVIRILPPQPAFEGDFVIQQRMHYGFKDKEGNNRTVACLRALDKDCPVCDFVEELQSTQEKDDEKLAQDLRAQTQLLTEVLVRPSKRLRIWRVPVGVYKNIAQTMAEPRIGDFTAKKTGRDISLVRKGQGLRTRYTVNMLDRVKIGTKRWKSQRVDFSRIMSPVLSRKRLIKMLRKQFG